MIRIHKYKDLGKGDYGWLQTSYHFSFGNYYNPSKTQLGSLRVLNDDYIDSNKGFDTHPHSDMEIITYVVSGKLTHQDSMGNKKVLGPHGVQYMSAGTGIYHSELNEAKIPLHLYQMWILPDKKGYIPNYGDQDFSQLMKNNSLLEIVSSSNQQGVIKISQEASVSIGTFDVGQTIDVLLNKYKYSYLVVIEGIVKHNDQNIGKGDAIESSEPYQIVVEKDTHIMLIKIND